MAVTPSATPIYALTIRAHVVCKNSIIATYAIVRGRNVIKVWYHHFDGAGVKALKRCKLEVLNEAIMAIGEGKKVSVCVEDDYILDFIRTGIMKGERYYQDIVDQLRTTLSLCSSVICSECISSTLFNAALQEYRSMKNLLYPGADAYLAACKRNNIQRRLNEARRFERAITNW